MVEARHIHGPQHPVGHVGRSWNLEEMPPLVQGHERPSRSCLVSGADLTFATLSPRFPPANVKSKAPLATITCQWSFDSNIRKRGSQMGCECWSRTTSQSNITNQRACPSLASWCRADSSLN